jgi:hypothetical protein
MAEAIPGALVADSAFLGRSKTMRYQRVLRTVYLAADAAAKERRRVARDAEEGPPTTEEELAEAAVDVDDLLACVKTWLADLPPGEASEFLEGLGRLAATGDPEMAASAEHIGGELLEDRAHRGVRGARRASGAGDFLDRAHRPTRPVHAGDEALRRHGIAAARERFPNIARITSMG